MSLFCPMCKAKNNEEYREVLKKRRFRFMLFVLTGMATEAVSLFLYFGTGIEYSEYHLGFMLGLGAGLLVGGLTGILRIQRLLRDEERLKEFRLKETDERELEVYSLAIRGAARLLLAVLYGMIFLGAIFRNEELVWICWGLIMFFLFSYFLFRKYYQSKI